MAQRYCTNCGNELESEDLFCAKCGRPARQTAAVETSEADVGVPPAPTSESRDATTGPSLALVAVFLVLLAIGTVQGMASSTPGETLAFRIGEGSVTAMIDAVTLTVVLLFLAGVYYATDRKNGTTFGEATFNWPMVVLASILTVLILAT